MMALESYEQLNDWVIKDIARLCRRGHRPRNSRVLVQEASNTMVPLGGILPVFFVVVVRWLVS
jgi:hypothetical protein